jgi:hypothetical protein
MNIYMREDLAHTFQGREDLEDDKEYEFFHINYEGVEYVVIDGEVCGDDLETIGKWDGTKPIFNKGYIHNEYECHVCCEIMPKEKGVACENGHSCCAIHHLERVRAMYQSNEVAFGAERLSGGKEGMGQKCFECRCHIDDDRFTEQYFKNLRLIQAVELPKMLLRQNGQETAVWTNEKAMKLMEDARVSKCLSHKGRNER